MYHDSHIVFCQSHVGPLEPAVGGRRLPKVTDTREQVDQAPESSDRGRPLFQKIWGVSESAMSWWYIGILYHHFMYSRWFELIWYDPFIYPFMVMIWNDKEAFEIFENHLERVVMLTFRMSRWWLHRTCCANMPKVERIVKLKQKQHYWLHDGEFSTF